MQEFLNNNTVSCNLMSLTGYRTLVIFGLLLNSPQSINELNLAFEHNQYIKEKFSQDSLRLYINALREIGCDISKASKANNYKFHLNSHPFEFVIKDTQISAVKKLLKNLYEKTTIDELEKIENLISGLIGKTKDLDTQNRLQSLLLLKKIDTVLFKDLKRYCKDKNQINFDYKITSNETKTFDFIADKLFIKSSKLYLSGKDLSHDGKNSFLPVDKIVGINSIKYSKSNENILPTKVVCEIYDKQYLLKPDEKLLKEEDKKLTIEISSINEFAIMQRVLQLGNKCKVIEPTDFKTRIIEKLKEMEKRYEQN